CQCLERALKEIEERRYVPGLFPQPGDSYPVAQVFVRANAMIKERRQVRLPNSARPYQEGVLARPTFRGLLNVLQELAGQVFSAYEDGFQGFGAHQRRCERGEQPLYVVTHRPLRMRHAR